MAGLESSGRVTGWRMVPPAHSPVSVRAALAAAARPGTDGTAVEAVEAWLRERFDARRCLLTGSGTGALTLALRTALRRAGSDRVALPAYACFDVATAAAGADARVDLYDLDPRTLAPDADSLERVLERGAGAVVVVHLYGHPVDVPAVREMAEGHGAAVIEDAAQGAGGRLDGRPLGALGELSVLSFGRGKARTAGAGGALLARSAEAAELLEEAARRLADRERRRGWREVGVALAQWSVGRPSLYRLPASLPFLGLGETTYRRPEPPEPMTAAAAEMLRRTHGRPDPAEDGRRREHARRLREELEDLPGIGLPEAPADGRSGALRLPALVPVRGGGAPALGIMPGYPALLDGIPAFRRRLEPGSPPTPGAARLRDELVTLPTHGLVTRRDLDAVLRWARARSAPRPAPGA